MGCDIHIFCEIRNAIGKWEYSKAVKPDDRNYDLFAILADVRNGAGFAGIKTGDGFIPVCQPKGLPDDVSKTVLDESEGWGGDGHSRSWLTIRELLAYNWFQKTSKTGLVQEEGFKQWKFCHAPSSYSGDAFGGQVEKISVAEMEKRIEGKTLTGHEHTRVAWDVYYHERAALFLKSAFLALGLAEGNPDNARFVFWFDN